MSKVRFLIQKINRSSMKWGDLRWGGIPILLAYSAAFFYSDGVFFNPFLKRGGTSVSFIKKPQGSEANFERASFQRGLQSLSQRNKKKISSCDVELILHEGDTIAGLLNTLGISQQQTSGALDSLKPLINPRELQVGLKINVRYKKDAEGKGVWLQTLSFSPEMGLEIQLKEQKNGFEARKLNYRLHKRQVAVQGAIKVSLYQDALKQGVSPHILHKLIRVLSYRFDFQRDFQKGDTFKFFYEETWDSKRGESRPETFLFVDMNLSGVPYRFYQFKRPGSQQPEFFDEKGRALRSEFLRTPVDGARLSSTFGKRRHPILGYTKMHKGVDFAAPRGSPVMAAGNGVVVKASYYGSYGNYILIRHSSGYHTAYAHLDRYGKGIRPGAQVSQGQVIGSIGTTGRSTGPHLHFELLKNGKQINPNSIRQLPSLVLTGKTFQTFRQYTQKMTQAYYAQVNHNTTTVL